MKKVLYLDDKKMLLDVYGEIMRHWGYEADTFSDAEEAFVAISDNPGDYHAVLVDYKMPNVSGVEFIKRLKQNNFFGVPNVALFSSMLWDEKVLEQIRREGLIGSPVSCVNKEVKEHKELKAYLENVFEQRS